MKAVLLCVTSILSAATPTTITIDCGSSTDSNFIGGLAFTLPTPPPGKISDATMRYGNDATPFRYKIPAFQAPYIVTLHFIEPRLTVKSGRLFGVSINNQTVIAGLDLFAEAGFMAPMSRSFVVVGSDGFIDIRFIPIFSNAVISSIDLTPLSTSFAVADLLDCNVIRTSDTQLLFNGSATTQKPCNLRIGPRVYAMNSSATVDLQNPICPVPPGPNLGAPPCQGSIYIYIRFDSGAPQLEVSSINIHPLPTCAGINCRVVEAHASDKFYPIAEWQMTTPGKWDAIGTDRRAILNIDGVTAGSGIQILPASDGTEQVSVP